MADELSTPTVSRWGYVVLDYIGLGFILVGPEEWVRTKLWTMSLVYVGIGAAFLFLGIMGPKIKSKAIVFMQSPKKLSEALVALDAANKRADENFGLYNDKTQELHEARAALREANCDLRAELRHKPSSQGEHSVFNRLSSEFGDMSWAQRLCLYIIWQKQYTRNDELRTQLLYYGIGRNVDEDIIAPLTKWDRTFVELTADGVFQPNEGRRAIIEELLRQFRENPF